MSSKKVERGTLYFAGDNGAMVAVRPLNGVKFTLDEWQKAVNGYVETMIPAVNGRHIFVNEEGRLKGLLPNQHTWTFANRRVYELNGYGLNWRVAGRALEIFKLTMEEAAKDDAGRVSIARAVR